MQLHPKDTGGSFFEIDEMKGEHAHAPDGPWRPAGPDWQAAATNRVTAIRAATMQCDDPAVVAARWSSISEIPLVGTSLPLENATLRFEPCTDGRGEGLAELDIETPSLDVVLAAAERIDARSGQAQVTLCGMRINLLEA